MRNADASEDERMNRTESLIKRLDKIATVSFEWW
jgi:hypothetical protein